jgi:hypothetical protein
VDIAGVWMFWLGRWGWCLDEVGGAQRRSLARQGRVQARQCCAQSGPDGSQNPVPAARSSCPWQTQCQVSRLRTFHAMLRHLAERDEPLLPNMTPPSFGTFGTPPSPGTPPVPAQGCRWSPIAINGTTQLSHSHPRKPGTEPSDAQQCPDGSLARDQVGGGPAELLELISFCGLMLLSRPSVSWRLDSNTLTGAVTQRYGHRVYGAL